MNAASKSARTRTQLASLRRLVRCIESGEEAARLRRILADIGEFETENEADVRGRLMELEDWDARQALLTVLGDQVADLEHRMITLSRARMGNLPNGANPTDCAASERLAVGQLAQSDGTSERLNSAEIQREVGIRGGTLGGVIAALGALAVAATFWFVAGVVFSLVNLDADRYLERHAWLTLVFGGSLVFAFLTALAYIAARDGGLPAWTLLLAGIAAGVPALGPDAILWPGLGAAVLIAAVLATVGERRPRPRPELTQRLIHGFAGGAVGLALLPAVAVGFASHPGPAPGRSSGGFCTHHRCIANFENGTGSVVQCSDGQWSHSGGRQGACSGHQGEGANTMDSASAPASTPDESSSPSASSDHSSETSEATATPIAPPAPSPADLEASARQFMRNYYSDLDLQDYRRAWNRLAPQMRVGLGSYRKWQAGFDDTIEQRVSSVSSTLAGEVASVALTLRSTDLDACGDSVVQRFQQSWTLSRLGGRWHATDVKSKRVSGRTPAKSLDACVPSYGGPSIPGASADPNPDCPYAACTEEFSNGRGSIIRCADGTGSHSGGIQGACSQHGGLGSSAPSLPPSRPLAPPAAGGTVQVDGYTRKDGTYVAPYTRRAPCTYCP